MLVGLAQFLPALRQRKPSLYRILGRIYVAGCLIGGVSALVLATGVSTDPVTGIGFGALGVAWLHSQFCVMPHTLASMTLN